MYATHPHVALPVSPPGWVRRCAACGEIDIHAVVPAPALFHRRWTCGGCGAGEHVAVRLGDVCPARQGRVA